MRIDSGKQRRGDPVIVTDANGHESPGTVEFYSERNASPPCLSLYMERGGRRVLFGETMECARPDPGGMRPMWHSLKTR